MAENDQLVSMAQAFTGLPMGDLIGGPLMAATKANNQMVMTQTKYILDTGFNRINKQKDDKKPPEYEYDPIVVSVKLKRPVITQETDKDGKTKDIITTVETVVEMPLISLIPIPSLGVDTVDITFDMEVKSSFGSTQSQSHSDKLAEQGSFEAKFGWGPFSVDVKGSVSHNEQNASSSKTTHQASNSAHYHVEVHASQQEMPKGMSLLLEAYAKNVGPYVMPSEGDGKKAVPGKKAAELEAA